MVVVLVLKSDVTDENLILKGALKPSWNSAT